MGGADDQLPSVIPALSDPLPYVLPLPHNIITMWNKNDVTNQSIQQLITNSINCFADYFEELIHRVDRSISSINKQID